MDFDLNNAIDQSSNLIAQYIGISAPNIAPTSTPAPTTGTVAVGAPQTGNPAQPTSNTNMYLAIGGAVVAIGLLIYLLKK